MHFHVLYVNFDEREAVIQSKTLLLLRRSKRSIRVLRDRVSPGDDNLKTFYNILNIFKHLFIAS
jgi:hypothetical protein